MKSGIVAALGAAFVFVLPGIGQAQVGRFMGGGTVYDFSQACADIGGWEQRPHAYVIRFHPDGVGNNDRDSISFISDNHAMNYARMGNGFARRFRPASLTGIFGSGFHIDQDDNAAPRVRILSMTPSNLDDTTAVPVRIRGQIRHFSGINGCSVSFEAVVQQPIE